MPWGEAMNENDWMDVRECASRLQLHPEVVRRWLRIGRLKGTKIGKAWRVSSQSIGRLYAEHSSPVHTSVPINRVSACVDRHDKVAGLTWLCVYETAAQDPPETFLTLAVNDASLHRGQRVEVQIPSDAILLSTHKLVGVSARNQWSGAIESLWVRHQGVEVRVGTTPQLVVWMTPNAVKELDLRPGKPVVLVFKASSCRVCA